MKTSTFFLYTALCVVLVSSAVVSAFAADFKWEPAVDGEPGLRKISPSGDILDSNMDALSVLSVAPIDIAEAKLTLKDLENPKKAAEIINKALYLPVDQQKLLEIKTDEIRRVKRNQRTVLNQASSHATSFGITNAQNAAEFTKRREKAETFIATAKVQREDMQVLNGITLGMLAEMNKAMALNSSLALLEAADTLSGSASMSGE